MDDNRKNEIEFALERAKELKSQPLDETYYERLLREFEFVNAMYEAHLFSGKLTEARPYRSERNHISNLIFNYEQKHPQKQEKREPLRLLIPGLDYELEDEVAN